MNLSPPPPRKVLQMPMGSAHNFSLELISEKQFSTLCKGFYSSVKQDFLQ